jgi:type I restriction enzyme S subunit
MIRTTNVRNGFIDTENVRYVIEAVFRKWTRRALPVPGDVVLTREAPLGEVGIIRYPDSVFLGQRTIMYRADRSRLDPYFLMYSMLSEYVQGQIRSYGSGSTVEHMRVPDCFNLLLPLPSLHVQRKISAILSGYDGLIENNNRRIKILEEMARRIYQEWFVDFRFPGHSSSVAAGSTAGQLPDGWQARPLRAVTAMITRGVSPRYSDAPNPLVINQKCIRNGGLSLELARRHETVVPADKLVRVGDVLINSTGVGTLGRVAQVLRDLKEVTVDSHVTIVRPAATAIDSHFLGMTLLGHEPELASMGIGSTGQTELGRTAIGNLLVALPPLNLQEMFANGVGPLRHLALRLSEANEVLRGTREFLLPRLISGAVDVADRDVTMPTTAA